MPTVLIGIPITSTLTHSASGDVGVLEYRLVNLATGAPAVDWATTGITQTTDAPAGPPWIYLATRDSTGLPAGTYQAQWRLPTAGPWIDDDEIELTLSVDSAEPIQLFRLYLDDVAGELFTDPQVAVLLAQYGDVRLAVAAAADLLALRFAGGIRKFTTDGQSFERGSRSAAYAELAMRMRMAAVNGEVQAYNVDVDLSAFGVTLSGSQLPTWTSPC